MATLIWRAPMTFYSEADESSFFAWLGNIPAVVGVRGVGRELHIRLKSRRLSQNNLREFIALYWRYGGDMSELSVFENGTNKSWFCCPNAFWYKRVFGSAKLA